MVLAGDRRPRGWRDGKAASFDAYDAKAEAIALLVDGATVRLLDATTGAEVVDAFDGAVRAVVTWHVERRSQGPAS